MAILVAALALGAILLDDAGRNEDHGEEQDDHPELASHWTPP